jgi:hypothetical protein
VFPVQAIEKKAVSDRQGPSAQPSNNEIKKHTRVDKQRNKIPMGPCEIVLENMHLDLHI